MGAPLFSPELFPRRNDGPLFRGALDVSLCTFLGSLFLAPIFPFYLHPLTINPLIVQTTTVRGWKAVPQTEERYLREYSSASNYWVAFCIACGRAYTRYEEAVAAFHGNDEAIAKTDVVRPTERLPERSDRMLSHLKSCRLWDATSCLLPTRMGALAISPTLIQLQRRHHHQKLPLGRQRWACAVDWA